jgi:hypothetical protein
MKKTFDLIIGEFSFWIVPQIPTKEFRPRMNTNSHEWEQEGEKQITHPGQEKDLCSFVFIRG